MSQRNQELESEPPKSLSRALSAYRDFSQLGSRWAGKRARVVEEVVVGKQVQERDQTVQDTVRRKDVEVENIPAAKAPPTAKPTNQPGPQRR